MQGDWLGGVKESLANGTESLLGAVGIRSKERPQSPSATPTQEPPEAGGNIPLIEFVGGVKDNLQARVSLVTKPAAVIIEEIKSGEKDPKTLATYTTELGIGLFNLVTGADGAINLFKGTEAKHSSEQPGKKTTDQSSKSPSDSTPATIFTDVQSKLDPDEPPFSLKDTPVPRSSLQVQQEKSQNLSDRQEGATSFEPPLTAPRRSREQTPITSSPSVAGESPSPARPPTPRFTSPPHQPARAEPPTEPGTPPPESTQPPRAEPPRQAAPPRPFPASPPQPPGDIDRRLGWRRRKGTRWMLGWCSYEEVSRGAQRPRHSRTWTRPVLSSTTRRLLSPYCAAAGAVSPSSSGYLHRSSRRLRQWNREQRGDWNLM